MCCGRNTWKKLRYFAKLWYLETSLPKVGNCLYTCSPVKQNPGTRPLGIVTPVHSGADFCIHRSCF